MKIFYINLGIRVGDNIYRIALLNFHYKSIKNTILWNRNWRKLFWKIYVNKINQPKHLIN